MVTPRLLCADCATDEGLPIHTQRWLIECDCCGETRPCSELLIEDTPAYTKEYA